SFGEGNASEGSKSFTSAAICVSKAAASKWVILWMPHWPATRCVQRVSTLLPRGEMAPNPVTTTRRSVQLTAIKAKGQPGQDQPAAPPKARAYLERESSMYLITS